MDIVLSSTDRLIQRSRFYWFKKRYLRAPYILIIVCVIIFFTLKIMLRETPPVNVIRSVLYKRNTVQVRFLPESVHSVPEYSFYRVNERQYILDIRDSQIHRGSNRSYGYGAIDGITYEKPEKDLTRITFSFSNLKDEPILYYSDNPPRFRLHFNRYLDNKFIVVIDPGHGGENTGATGQAGTIEKYITLDISKKLESLLKGRDDIQVYMTRRKDDNIGLFQRRRMSNFWDADLFLSIHANSAPNKEVNHSEIYYASAHARNSADIIRSGLEQTLRNGRGFTRRRGFAVIRRNTARLGALLVETMYLSNQDGEKFLNSDQYQQAIAQSLFTSVEKIIDLAVE